MAKSPWKPVDELEPEDFEEHPLWGFDLGRGESEPDADESFVRPYRTVDAKSEFSTTYFALVKVTLADGTTAAGVLSFHIEFAQVVPQALEVQGKRRLFVPMGMAPTAPYVKKELERFRKLFPLRYEARLKSRGGRPLVIDSEVDPLRAPPPPPPDALDLTIGLGPLLWSDSARKAMSRFPDATTFEYPRYTGAPLKNLTVEMFLEIDGVTLGARISLIGERVVAVALAPAPTDTKKDRTAFQRTLARRLGCAEALRIPGMQRWSFGGCEVELQSRGAREFFFEVRPPDEPPPKRAKRPRTRS